MTGFGNYEWRTYTAPFWKGDRVLGESAFVSEDFGGTIRPIRLAYPIRTILGVQSADLQIRYEEGRDYRVNGYGELEILRSGNIPYLPWKEYRFPVYDAGREDQMASADGLGAYRIGDLFSGQEGMRAWRLCVSYTHEESGYYDIAADKSGRFPRLLRLLKERRTVRVVSYGDSITYGWAASGMQDIRKLPYCKPYAEMIVDALCGLFSVPVEHVNRSVSGKCTDWAEQEENLAQIVSDAPDLVLLAFGMNDGGVFRPEQFGERISNIIRRLRIACPQTEFLLVSPILPNPLVGFSSGSSVLRYHREYPRVLAQIERDTEGVACADVTAVHLRLLERKSLQDTLSNNINHPDDFMHRVYAQVALRTMLGARAQG